MKKILRWVIYDDIHACWSKTFAALSIFCTFQSVTIVHNQVKYLVYPVISEYDNQ